MEYIKIDEDTVKEVKETIIDISAIRDEIASLTDKANSIEFISIPKGLPVEVAGLIEKENTDREMNKSWLLELARQKQAELDKYNG